MTGEPVGASQEKVDALGEALGSTVSYADAIDYLRDNGWLLVRKAAAARAEAPRLTVRVCRCGHPVTSHYITGYGDGTEAARCHACRDALNDLFRQVEHPFTPVAPDAPRDAP